MRWVAFLFSWGMTLAVAAQTNIFLTNPNAEAVLLGNYDPADYAPATVNTDPTYLSGVIDGELSADSLKAILFELTAFQNRNTGSDTVSADFGIGAARRWAHRRFERYAAESGGRLEVGYLQFDQVICEMARHRNVVAVLPGSNPAAGSLLVEAHMDSRCEDRCDTECLAQGMEDNGSGTALVLELARVMSTLSLERTVVFMLTTGEEQGLSGANAFAQYVEDQNIDLRAVFNNDVIGGVICGETSSAPSCPGLNDIDSTHVRIFSANFHRSKHKQLARYVKMQYEDELRDQVAVPMDIVLMSGVDRTGRGGDHIPFSDRDYAAVRFTSANEHGDAGVSDPDYHDRQHTTTDELGVDTDADGVIDSFFVNFNYLRRNAVINGTATAMAAISPDAPAFIAEDLGDSVRVTITDPLDQGPYKVMIITNETDFDTVVTLTNTNNVTLEKTFFLTYASTARLNADGVESLFSEEFKPTVVSTEEVPAEVAPPVILLQNKPNPFDEATWITYVVNEPLDYQRAQLHVTDSQGQVIRRLDLRPQLGVNEVLYRHGYGVAGVYGYQLVIDGIVVASKRMIFAN